MHLGRTNSKFEYNLGGSILKSSKKERDLGIIVDDGLKFSEQCNVATRNANIILGMIKRSITNKNKNVILRLYKTLVRPHLEYCVQAWRPFLKGDIANLENVQRRASKMIAECGGLKYSDRLALTG